MLDLVASRKAYSLDRLGSQTSIVLSTSLRGKEYFVTVTKAPGIGSVSGSHAFPGKWNGLNPTQTESVGVLVPQGKLGCCYKKKENGQTLIRQARKTPQGFSSFAVETERHSLWKTLSFN